VRNCLVIFCCQIFKVTKSWKWAYSFPLGIKVWIIINIFQYSRKELQFWVNMRKNWNLLFLLWIRHGYDYVRSTQFLIPVGAILWRNVDTVCALFYTLNYSASLGIFFKNSGNKSQNKYCWQREHTREKIQQCKLTRNPEWKMNSSPPWGDRNWLYAESDFWLEFSKQQRSWRVLFSIKRKTARCSRTTAFPNSFISPNNDRLFSRAFGIQWSMQIDYYTVASRFQRGILRTEKSFPFH
jgi:hypothetical protein